MRTADFANSPSGSLVTGQLTRKSPQGGSERVDYHAFLPNALPPAIEVMLQMATNLEEATHALGSLSELGRSIQNPHLLTRPFIRREAVLSSRIEGTRAGIQDVYEFEAAEHSQKLVSAMQLPLDVREVVNYVHAMAYAAEMVHERPVTLSFIRELHEILMQDVRGGDKRPGEFRDEAIWIGGMSTEVTEARYVPPRPCMYYHS